MVLKETNITPGMSGKQSSGDHLRRSRLPHSGTTLFSHAEEAGERLAVWQSIACLWLAQELGEHELQIIARILAQSSYDWSELQRIYLYEVAPAVHTNLRTGGGVWGAFDTQWLKGAIMKNMRNPQYRQDALRNRERMTDLVARDWERIKQHVHELRAGRKLTAEEQGASARLLQTAEQ